MKLSISEAARLAGVTVPTSVPARCFCPIRKHKRKDKTFRIFRGSDGSELWKCWSCDEPENAGDGLKLFCVITGRDRKDAFKMLLDRGFEFDGVRPREHRAPIRHPKRFVEPARGPAGVLELPPASLANWVRNDLSEVDAYLRSRGLTASDWHEHDVVSMGGEFLGFVYRDADTGVACRVKVRGIRQKRYWNEPRSDPSRPDVKAKAPLWLAHRLAYGKPAVIVEGEIDALTLTLAGVSNVVSLPDGSESAGTVDLRVLRESCPTWLVMTDADEPGEKAWRVLQQRAAGTGNQAIRCKLVSSSGETFKDANEALVVGKFSGEDFARCLQTL